MTTLYGAGNTGFEHGASQFAGGGFMPSQTTAAEGGQKGSSFDSKNQTLRAFTIKQIFDASTADNEGQLTIDGREVSNVTVVGKITAIEQQSLVCVYTIDDGTGSIQAKYWISEQDDALDKQLRAEWRVGVYVRAHGHLNSFLRERMLIAFNIRVISDYNEITYHGLQSIFQHLHLTRGLPAAQGIPAGFGGAAAPAPLPGGAAAAPTFDLGTGLTAVQGDVLGILKAVGEPSPNGATIESIVAASQGRYSPGQVRQALEKLQDEGHAYVTIDDHFKAC